MNLPGRTGGHLGVILSASTFVSTDESVHGLYRKAVIYKCCQEDSWAFAADKDAEPLRLGRVTCIDLLLLRDYVYGGGNNCCSQIIRER